MAIMLPGCLKYFSIVIMIFAILYKYEIPSDRFSSDKKTFVVTKKAVVDFNRSQVFKIITNINKYAIWYPNVADVKHIPLGVSKTEDEKYELITKMPLIGNISSVLIIDKIDRPKQFIFSINTWLLEMNFIELKDNLKNKNSTHIEWTVYTNRRSLLFQYLLLPFAKFYKNQIVREALFQFRLQIHNL